MADMQDNGYREIIYTAEMKGNKDDRVIDAGW